MLDKEFAPHKEAFELKELGFDEPCLGLYKEDGSFLYADVFSFREPYSPSEFKEGVDEGVCYINSEILEELTTAPTFSQAFRWFREKHKLMFQIFYLRNGNHAALIHKTTPEYMDIVDQIRPSGCVEEVVDCYSYEEAELECLRKLIEIVKNG